MKKPQKSEIKFILIFGIPLGVILVIQNSSFSVGFNRAALLFILGILVAAIIWANARSKPEQKQTSQVTPAPDGIDLRLFSANDGVISLEVTNQTSSPVLVHAVDVFLVVSVHYDGMPALGGNGLTNVKITVDAGPIGMLDGGKSKIYEISGPNTPVAIIEMAQNLRQFSHETDERYARRKTQSDRLKDRINADFAAAPSLAHLVEDNSGPYYLEARLEGGTKSTVLPRKPS